MLMETTENTVLEVVLRECSRRPRMSLSRVRVEETIKNTGEGFYKDATSLHICWECQALMRRMVGFRQRACVAQKLLSRLAEGQTELKQVTSLSCLSPTYKATFDLTIASETDIADNFIDCSAVEIKLEDDSEDLPLSELRIGITREQKAGEDSTTLQAAEDNAVEDLADDSPFISAVEFSDSENQTKIVSSKNSHKKARIKKKTLRKKTRKKTTECFKIVSLSEKEMAANREKKKEEVIFINAVERCESCILVFEDRNSMEDHNLCFHNEKPYHKKCDICLSYVPQETTSEHRDSHYLQYACQLCEHVAYTIEDISKHCDTVHIKQAKTPSTKKSDSKPRRNQATRDQRTPLGYQCTECNKYFQNKNQRWKHIQRAHREGFSCHVCGKRFAFRSNLTRHEKLHEAPLPREECKVCHKLVRTDLAVIHARTHTARASYACATCNKTFVSRASYTTHLKYANSHATQPVYKFKCPTCSKGFRSRGELRDHENYRHKGHTQHQCPVCGKALATRRCIRRHVRRAHEGVKENARDKICQQCGKAFRDKKSLREHEYTHTGERPLCCEVCNASFRQSASLYTHRKRVHNIHTARTEVKLIAT